MPSDTEFEEYVAYAMECRRRVKEQMNKRKPDDEFARIDLSYIEATGKEVVVYCPESRDAPATQNPTREQLSGGMTGQTPGAGKTVARGKKTTGNELGPAPEAAPAIIDGPTVMEVKEQHFTIKFGDTGHSYETIIGPYLAGVKVVDIEDPYIRLPHQIQNFVRFCEGVVKAGTVRKINLVTGYDDNTKVHEIQDKLGELKQSLLEIDVELDIRLNPNLHDREIRLDNGWIIKIGRGLDFFQKPASWFEIGANDLTLRKCLETKVDIYKGTT